MVFFTEQNKIKVPEASFGELPIAAGIVTSEVCRFGGERREIRGGSRKGSESIGGLKT